jgi:hypothetical protein
MTPRELPVLGVCAVMGGTEVLHETTEGQRRQHALVAFSRSDSTRNDSGRLRHLHGRASLPDEQS